jgi:ribosomal protein S18 acetylase RimI-like enzyme
MERLADVVILPAGPADAADLGALHVATWRQTYPGLLPQAYLAAMRPEQHARRFHAQLARARPGEVVLAAEGAGGLVGYCAGSRLTAGDRLADAEVFTLYLLKSAQGAGLGRRLLAAASRALAADGAKSLVVWVLTRNTAARGFYERLGGKAIGQRPVSGWGGGLLETAYRWDDIRKLAA